MNITPFYFYCLIKNITSFVKKGEPENLEKSSYFLVYERQKDFLKNIYKKIWNDFENGFFTVEEFKIYLLYKNLFGKPFLVTCINTREVKETSKMFSDEQWNKDQMAIQGICKNINIKNIKDFLNFKLEDGPDIVENLVKEGKISPMILVKYSDKIEYKVEKTKTIINKIKQIINKD